MTWRAAASVIPFCSTTWALADPAASASATAVAVGRAILMLSTPRDRLSCSGQR